MSPAQQLQRLLAEIPACEGPEIIRLLPLTAALQSAIFTRILAFQQLAGLPDTDYLLNVQQVAKRLGKSSKWLRENRTLFRFAFPVGHELRFSARGLEQWITSQRAD